MEYVIESTVRSLHRMTEEAGHKWKEERMDGSTISFKLKEIKARWKKRAGTRGARPRGLRLAIQRTENYCASE